jgi:hypothetical protein
MTKHTSAAKFVYVTAGVVISLGLIVAGRPAQAHAGTISPMVQVTETACGGGIYAVNTTPLSQFDPTTLSNTQLAAINYPPRPTDPTMVATWEKFVRHGLPHTSCALGQGHPGHGPQRAESPPTTASPDNIPPEKGIWFVNWAGNVVNNHTYDNAQGYWKEPLGSANAGDQAYSSSWVGLGQGSSAARPIIQAGSDSDTYLGARHFDLWWEVFPENSSQTITTNTAAGDQIYAKVDGWTNQATMQVYDQTKGTGGTYHYNSGSFDVDGTAEWILERTWVGYYPHLANSTTTFTSAAASAPDKALTGVGNLPHYYVDMSTCTSGVLMAYPGAISSDGFSFTDYWANYGDVCQ